MLDRVVVAWTRWVAGLLLSLATCTTTGLAQQAGSFAKGADVSWLSEMEAAGYRFYSDAGQAQDLLQILKDHGIDAVRLRVWVNPKEGWNGVDDVVRKALRAKRLGLRVMIDFHYSDSWADPGKQNKPKAWVGHTYAQLVRDVQSHTHEVMSALLASGISPEWAQVGNETNDGMLWNEGKASENMRNFPGLVSSGYAAIKAASPSTKVIVHVSNAYDNALFRWMFDGLRSNGAKWDIIGMSLYPTASDWQPRNRQAASNMSDMRARYKTDVMLVEIGMGASPASTSKAFISDLLVKARAAGALGVFYWEPQAYNWQGYAKGAWQTDGRPSVAMDAFLEKAAP